MLQTTMRKILCLIPTFIVCLLTSCYDEGTYYHHYESVNGDAWNQRDTLFFDLDTLWEDASLSLSVGLRSNTLYPYPLLALEAQTQVLDGTDAQRVLYSKKDTLNVEMYDEKGHSLHDGLSFQQTEIPLCTFRMHKGHICRVSIRHIMRREEIPGIKDVGVKATFSDHVRHRFAGIRKEE
jgi:gliding motility-associated lipoprotein GldH